MNEKTTAIRNADYIVAWDATLGSHVYLRHQDVVFRDDSFLALGGRFEGPVDQEIDGRNLMVMPGLLNIHSHPSSEPGNKGLLDDVGSPRLGQSNLYDIMKAFSIPSAFAPAARNVAIAEALRSGVTTFTDWSAATENWIEEFVATGIRPVFCPRFHSATWFTEDGHNIGYTWDEEKGRRDFARAREVVETALSHPSGTCWAMLGPSQIDTCSEGLLRDSHAYAREAGLPWQLHTAQSFVEFTEITRRTGLTPVAWLSSIGVLTEGSILGHGIFLNDHPKIHYPQADDFEVLKASGAAVAHCPVNFMRRGIALNTLARYMDSGITVGLGTDTYPHNMIDEMKAASLAGRILQCRYDAGSTRHAFTAATIGGARALLREDLGRIAVGAKADFSLVDLDNPYMQPLRDPLKNLITVASDRVVRDVYVNGRQVVAKGEVLTIDLPANLALLAEAQAQMMAAVPKKDWGGRTIDEISPLSFPLVESVGAAAAE